METDVLLLQLLVCGTTFQLIWDKLILTLNSLNNCWRHFCLVVWLTLKLTFQVILLTYLLTTTRERRQHAAAADWTDSPPACVWMGNWALASKGCRSMLGIITLKHLWPSCLWMLQCSNSWHCLFGLQPACCLNADSTNALNLPPLLVFSLSLFSFLLTPLHTVWCPSNFYMTSYQWYCSVAAVLCFILVSNVIHVTCYLLNQFVFIICVVAREHEEQFLSLIF